ncbi:AAA family ATPase [Ventrimonas faecis]
MNTLQGYICNSRPRRFGKSIAANMLTAYYSRGCDSEAMFSGLTIGQAPDFKTHLNRYDVIHLDIQWCIEPAGGAEKVVSYITEKTVGELREYYPAEIPEHVKSLPEALSCVNGATGRKFILIIDEWDVLIRDEADNQKIQEDYIRFLRALFKGTEPTKYIQLAYLTGILPIKKVKTQSALNNFDEYTMLFAGALAPYVGFTEDEVRRLCGKYQRDFEKVKRWYDGYLLGNYQVYNPRAVVTLMLNGQFKSYWSETGSYEAIVPLLNMDFDGLKSALIEMIAGNSVEVQVGTFQNDVVNFANKDDVLTYLIHLGYLAYDQNTERAFVPNEEIRQELIKATQRKKWNEFLDFQRESFVLLDATLDMDAETVAEQIEKIHMDYASAIQYHNENSLSSVLSIAYLSAMQYYFKPVRELPTGRGFADFVFIPKPEYIQDYPAMVVELKWNRSAKTAMQQIKERHYPDSLKAYTGEILLVAVNYDKKTKVHQCLIEKYEKEG